MTRIGRESEPIEVIPAGAPERTPSRTAEPAPAGPAPAAPDHDPVPAP